VLEIRRSKAAQMTCPTGVGSLLDLLVCARTDDRREFAVKTSDWPMRGCRNYRIRLAVEFVYYAYARENQVPTPEARVLELPNDVGWGTEILPGRVQLTGRDMTLTEAEREAVKAGFLSSCDARDEFLRLSFLDVLLLNQDRTESNVLKQQVEGATRLSFIDHEQSLGWRSNIEVPAENGIKSPEIEFSRIADRYARFGRKYGWGLQISTGEERRTIFQKMKCDPSLFDEIGAKIPDGWLSSESLRDMRVGLGNWWAYLERKPYEEIDQLIFGASVAPQ
jgi:hypothetical protein